MRERLVVVVDLEKDPVAISIERAEVVFFVGIVGVAEIVVYGNRLDDALDGLLAERGDAGRDHCHAANKMLAKVVVERTNLVGLGRHGWSPSDLYFAIHSGNPTPRSAV